MPDTIGMSGLATRKAGIKTVDQKRQIGYNSSIVNNKEQI